MSVWKSKTWSNLRNENVLDGNQHRSNFKSLERRCVFLSNWSWWCVLHKPNKFQCKVFFPMQIGIKVVIFAQKCPSFSDKNNAIKLCKMVWEKCKHSQQKMRKTRGRSKLIEAEFLRKFPAWRRPRLYLLNKTQKAQQHCPHSDLTIQLQLCVPGGVSPVTEMAIYHSREEY